jgi:AraC-like DNA-binding protein
MMTRTKHNHLHQGGRDFSSRIIQEAKTLLKQTDWNIPEISYTLGFGDLSNFSKFFKKQTSFTSMVFRS